MQMNLAQPQNSHSLSYLQSISKAKPQKVHLRIKAILIKPQTTTTAQFIYFQKYNGIEYTLHYKTEMGFSKETLD